MQVSVDGLFLNGYPVVQFTKRPNGYSTVMVEKVDRVSAQTTEFVVATWWPELGNGWMWGHYFPVRDGSVAAARAEAEEAFAAQVDARKP